MRDLLICIAVVVGSYLIGSVNNALIISKIKKQDVRTMGSGNPGTMNMLRNYGVVLGVVTLAADALKGAVPCLLGWWLMGDFLVLGPDRIGIFIAGLFVIIGHIFPVFLKFKGGKGIASTIGICLVMNPIVTVITFAVGAAFLIVTKMGSVTSFIIISFPLAVQAIYSTSIAERIIIFFIFALTLFAHRKNIVKLFMGKESKTVLFGKNKSAKKRQAA